MVIVPHRAFIKSSESLEKKRFIAMCLPYPFIGLQSLFLHDIKEKARENNISLEHKTGGMP